MSGELLLWFKAFHIMSVIAWMAGLFYLPRLMVYHTKVTPGSEASETFKVMERRLLKAITTPAMISSWVFGLLIAWGFGSFTEGWLHLKLLMVFFLSGFHGMLAKHVREFATDSNRRPERYYRIINEFPTVIMVVVVILVVLRPF